MSDNQIVLVLLLSVLVIAVLAGVRWYRRDFSTSQLLLWYSARLLIRWLWGARYQNRWPLRKGQGVVVICNHRSSIDPFFIQSAVPYPMRWMVAREYIGKGLMGWFLKTVNVIPVGRGGVDTAATKAAIRFAAEGGAVGMLPEGRINVTDEFMLPVRPGAILVALRAGVPVLPCYVEGAPYGGTATSPFTMRAHVRIVFGQLMDLSGYRGREGESGLIGELTLEAVRRIAALAGHDEFQPKLAGRRWKPEVQEQLAGNGAADEEANELLDPPT